MFLGFGTVGGGPVATASSQPPQAVAATLAATEAPDTAALTASLRATAALAGVEAPDTAFISAGGGLSLVLAATEPSDSAAATANIRTSATLAVTEVADVAAFTSPADTGAVLVSTEAPDVAVVAARVTIGAILAASEAPDAIRVTFGGRAAALPRLATEQRAMYRRHLAAYGETVTIKRYNGPEATALARISGWTMEEIASGVAQGARKVVLLAEDLETAGFPPIERNDGLFVRGARLNVEGVDDSTRRVAGVLIAYELGVEG